MTFDTLFTRCCFTGRSFESAPSVYTGIDMGREFIRLRSSNSSSSALVTEGNITQIFDRYKRIISYVLRFLISPHFISWLTEYQQGLPDRVKYTGPSTHTCNKANWITLQLYMQIYILLLYTYLFLLLSVHWLKGWLDIRVSKAVPCTLQNGNLLKYSYYRCWNFAAKMISLSILYWFI